MVFIAAGTAQGGECVVLSVDLHSGCSVRLDVAKCQFFWLFLLDGYARLAVCFHWFVKADAAFLPVSRICPHKSGFSCGKKLVFVRNAGRICAEKSGDLCGKRCLPVLKRGFSFLSGGEKHTRSSATFVTVSGGFVTEQHFCAHGVGERLSECFSRVCAACQNVTDPPCENLVEASGFGRTHIVAILAGRV